MRSALAELLGPPVPGSPSPQLRPGPAPRPHRPPPPTQGRPLGAASRARAEPGAQPLTSAAPPPAAGPPLPRLQAHPPAAHSEADRVRDGGVSSRTEGANLFGSGGWGRHDAGTGRGNVTAALGP